jgi:hypothetical protein
VSPFSLETHNLPDTIVAMAVRYISLGLDDQDLYILAGIFFALMYGLRPSFSKLQRPGDRGPSLKIATHLIFAECCCFATSAVLDVHYETLEVLVAAATSILPEADYPKS